MQILVRAFAAILLAAGLSGCFSSDKPLIGADIAVFPYQKIVYTEEDRDEPQTLTRTGDAYILTAPNSEETARIRFAPAGNGLGANFYVAEMEFTQDDQTRRLYAVLKLDAEAKQVQSYVAVKPDDPVKAPGLTPCEEDTLCIDSLGAYLDYAKQSIESGRPPDAVYTLISLE